jgi:hypothetical protein
MGLHDHFSKLPKATFDAVKKSFKNELHQFKEAASGVKTWLGGKPMSRAQKNAVFTVCWDTTVLALGLALPMIMAGHAGTTVAGAATKRFAQDLAKKIAVNALKEELNDYTIPGSVQEFGYGMHHLVDFGKGLTAAGKKPKADDGDLMTAFTMGLINRTMSKMTPEKFASMIEDIATGEDLDKPEPTKDNKKTANAWMITSKGVVETV